MHLKNVRKRLMVLGLTFSLCVSNFSMISAAELPSGQSGETELSVVEKEDESLAEETGGNGSAVDESEKDPEVQAVNSSEDELTKADSIEAQDLESEEEGETLPEPADEPEQVSFELTKAEFTDESEREFEIELSNCDMEEGDSLRAAVWSDDKGQDDLKWLTLEKIKENTYGTKITIADYKSPGEYVFHVYHQKADGSKVYVTGKRFQVTSLSAGNVAVEEQTYEEGTASIKVSGMESPSGIERVRVAVWSTADQKDLYWYEAVCKDDAWYVDMDIAKYHKNNWNVYMAHAYATDGNGFEKFVGGTKVDFSFEKTSATVTVDNEKQIVTISVDADNLKTPGKIESIRCALWSDDKGQDDLKWYTLEYDSSTEEWLKEVPLSMFRSTGICYAHIYLVKSDKTEVFLTGNSFKLENPTLKTVTVYTDNENGTFGITLNDLKTPLGYQKVEIAVWSQADQKDLKWYEAKAQNDGTFTVNSSIAQHKYNIGKYNIHIYITDGLGIRSCLKCTSMEFKSDVGTLSVANDAKETSYVVTLPVNEYPAGLKEVSFGVWSNTNGQDDLKWYTAVKSGNDYKATISIKNHKTMGTYSVHAYGVNQAGNKVFLAGHGALINITGTASGTISISEKNDQKGTFKVVLSNANAPSGISSVRLAAWTQSNQSDLYWYTLTKQSDGTWTALVDISNHKYNSGTYYLHAYATMGNQIQSYAAGTAYKFEPKNLVYVLNDQGKGKRTIVICNPSSTSNLRFGVWSETGGQDDLYWYTASKGTGGKWTATVNGANHKHGGTFNLHVYAGSATCLSISTFTIPASEMAKNGWYYEVLNGKTYKLYYVNDVMQTDVSGIIGRQSSYMAEVNRTTCTVTIYAKDGANGYIIPVKAFTCSVGLPSTPTPTGTYYTCAKYRWQELMGPSYGQYCTRIVGGILFHSVAGSNMTSYNLSAAAYNMLGSPASHGCVRLCVRDAKWIYDNCSLGMETRIFDSSYPGPFGKPATIKIPASQNWDPTDPNI